MTIRRCHFVALLLGALVAAPAAEKEFSAAERSHWAFQPVSRPPLPARSAEANPIDAFTAAPLGARGLQRNPPADRATFLRRAALDLTGLPPAPEDLRAFLDDARPDAEARAIDRLLASPRYGERWARHWLDLARYAESEGFKADETRPNAWRYRDYVINAFNADKPYDRFLSEQLAGDELWPDDPDALVATAFNRHYADESNARNLMQRRQEILNDITDTVGAVFTGLTYGCARCHDHKFDPILQTDYFRLQAFFANTAANDLIPLAPPARRAEHAARLAVWEEQTRALREEMESLEAPKRREIIDEYVDKYPAEIQAALAKPTTERNPFECQMVAKAELYLNPASHQYLAPTSAVIGRLKGDARKRWDALNTELKSFEALHPGKLPIGTGIHDLGPDAPETHRLGRGNWDAPKEPVPPGFLTLVSAKPAHIAPVPNTKSTGRRAALAKLLTDPANPLTARVMVNRLWHYHFGRGLVATPSDFGFKGERPTHPELLDWLATEFVRTGWSIKQVHRLIMTSQTYQQASAHRTEAAAADPDNRLLWRFPRHRLEGEVIRDAALAVSGLLNPRMGGPSVFPEMPPGLESRGGWKPNAELAERNRRSVYVFVRRNTRYPLFETFDMPDTHESCARRNVTTSPLQALSMLNNKLGLQWAQAFAGRVLARAGDDREKQIQAAYQLAFARTPDTIERAMINEFFAQHSRLVAERTSSGEPLALPLPLAEGADPAAAATLVDFCHMLLNANEFVYAN